MAASTLWVETPDGKRIIKAECFYLDGDRKIAFFAGAISAMGAAQSTKPEWKDKDRARQVFEEIKMLIQNGTDTIYYKLPQDCKY